MRIRARSGLFSMARATSAPRKFFRFSVLILRKLRKLRGHGSPYLAKVSHSQEGGLDCESGWSPRILLSLTKDSCKDKRSTPPPPTAPQGFSAMVGSRRRRDCLLATDGTPLGRPPTRPPGGSAICNPAQTASCGRVCEHKHLSVEACARVDPCWCVIVVFRCVGDVLCFDSGRCRAVRSVCRVRGCE